MMVLMRPEREMSPSSALFMLRVGMVTSVDLRARISGSLVRRIISHNSQHDCYEGRVQ